MKFNRALHPDDYINLFSQVERLATFENTLQGIFYRKDHRHREWEYANILYELEYLRVSKHAKILDTGSGCSYFPPFLVKSEGFTDVTVSDSMDYGDIESGLIQQCLALDIRLPLLKCPLEDMGGPDEFYDVTMCVSTIEHVASDKFLTALQELHRITKPGGLILMTSDFFSDDQAHLNSPFKDCQHTCFTPEMALTIPNLIDVEFVEGTDFTYQGDFVNNYSFVNFCLRRL